MCADFNSDGTVASGKPLWRRILMKLKHEQHFAQLALARAPGAEGSDSEAQAHLAPRPTAKWAGAWPRLLLLVNFIAPIRGQVTYQVRHLKAGIPWGGGARSQKHAGVPWCSANCRQARVARALQPPRGTAIWHKLFTPRPDHLCITWDVGHAQRAFIR